MPGVGAALDVFEVLRGVAPHGRTARAGEQAGMLDRHGGQGARTQSRRLSAGLGQARQGGLVEGGVGSEPGDGLAQTLDQLTADERREVGLRGLAKAQDESLVDRRAPRAHVGQPRHRRVELIGPVAGVARAGHARTSP